MTKRKGFTFVEVMFGISIVGIISAMVIPIFYNTYANKVKGTQLKKACAQISYAIDAIMADERANDEIGEEIGFSAGENEQENAEETSEGEGENTDPNNTESENTEQNSTEGENSGTQNTENTVSTGFYLTSAGVKTSNATQGAEYFLNKYFKHTSTNCGPGGTGTCIAAEYRSPNKKNLGTIDNGYYCIKTTNSAAVCMMYDEEHHVSKIIVDINGNEKPNVSGSDIFVMYVTPEGELKDLDDDETKCNMDRTEGVSVEGFSAGCFTKVVANGWVMPN